MMLSRLRSHLTFANVVAVIALFIALGGVGAYATHPGGVNTISSDDIQPFAVENRDLATDAVDTFVIANSQVKAIDLADLAVNKNKLGPDSVSTTKVLNDTVSGGGLTNADLRPDSVGQSEISTAAVGNNELAFNSITGLEVVDNSLSANDIVAADRDAFTTLWAVINANGTIVRHRGVSSAGKPSVGLYTVRFARDVRNCAVSATLETFGGTEGEISAFASAFEADGVIVGTADSSGTAQDRTFHLAVHC